MSSAGLGTGEEYAAHARIPQCGRRTARRARSASHSASTPASARSPTPAHPRGRKRPRSDRARSRGRRTERRAHDAATRPRAYPGTSGIRPLQSAGDPRGVAQLVEHRSPKPGVAGSIPVSPVAVVLHRLRTCHETACTATRADGGEAPASPPTARHRGRRGAVDARRRTRAGRRRGCRDAPTPASAVSRLFR